MEDNVKKQQKNVGLDTFRAFAFFAVFAVHAGFLKCGYLGVQAFFVLSGFLLTPILIAMKEKQRPRDYFINFYGRRALRIFPLYYFYLFVVGILAFILPRYFNFNLMGQLDTFVSQVWYCITYTYDFFHATSNFKRTALMSHFWSLAVEEQFYLVYPLIIFFVDNNRFRTLLFAVAISAPVIRFMEVFLHSKYVVPYFIARMDIFIYVIPFSYLDSFAIGGIAALYCSQRDANFKAWLAIIFTIGIGTITEFISTGSIELSSLGYKPYLSDSYKYIWGYTLLNIVFASILIAVKSGNFIGCIFNNPVLSYIGKISYGLYVYHYPVLWILGTYFLVKPYLIFCVLSLTVTILVSICSYELLEKRLLLAKDSLFPIK